MALQEQDTLGSQKPFVDSGKASIGVSSGETLKTSATVGVPQIGPTPSFNSWQWGPLWRE